MMINRREFLGKTAGAIAAASTLNSVGALSAVPQALIVEHGVTTGASFAADIPYNGAGEALVVPEGLEGNVNYLAMSSFICCLRNNKRPSGDERAGWNSGVTIALGNLAIRSGQRVNFADHIKPQAS